MIRERVDCGAGASDRAFLRGLKLVHTARESSRFRPIASATGRARLGTGPRRAA
eukprot:CAMPEP_0201913602 /NCGR_PEP_ID=MMETSP0903-20130614/4013_1 /ASSEMBLY_ACC=CAM_ASM_000552 /TAXON_ID=420261 /ORGANISM="Thalassiosira antarctica, Strain CCMP982" /LENGTH=53 /DNA_ID=CAMNT_0048448837 /DNA_START=10 /DNA_END=167 /DNA_ORIENTATION=-